jgi:hypothetical protein
LKMYLLFCIVRRPSENPQRVSPVMSPLLSRNHTIVKSLDRRPLIHTVFLHEWKGLSSRSEDSRNRRLEFGFGTTSGGLCNKIRTHDDRDVVGSR